MSAQRAVAPAAKNRGQRRQERVQVGTEAASSRAVVYTSVALALSGYAALGMEIIWFRHFSIMLGAFRAVFSLLLTVILLGMGERALIAGVLQRHTKRAAEWLLVTQALFILFTLGGMAAADS